MLRFISSCAAKCGAVSVLVAALAVTTPAVAQETAPPAASVAAAPFTFVVFGDNRPASAKLPVPDVFKQILAEVRRLHPAFVVTTGDLIYGDAKDTSQVERQYDEVLPFVRAIDVPVYFAPGNHEIRNAPANEAIYKKRVYPSLYYSFDYGSAHFTILDTDQVGLENRITGVQYDWLEKDLGDARARGAKHLFVFEHAQPYPVSSHIGSSLDAFPADRDRFQALLEKNKVEALITGHEHLYDDSVHGGVREIIAGGAGAPLYPSLRGGSFYHYMVITVDGDKTYYSVVKPGAVYGADDILTLAPGEKRDPGKSSAAH